MVCSWGVVFEICSRKNEQAGMYITIVMWHSLILTLQLQFMEVWRQLAEDQQLDATLLEKEVNKI